MNSEVSDVCNGTEHGIVGEYCSWHDLAMVHENHHMRRALKKGKPYEFKVLCLSFQPFTRIFTLCVPTIFVLVCCE